MPTPTTPDHQPTPEHATAHEHAAEARRAAARAWVARTRAAQGLPRHVQDPKVIAELVMLFRPMAGDRRQAQHHGGGDLPGVATPPADRAADPSAG